MTGIVIYMEGGGSSNATKVKLRQGMDEFLWPLKQIARQNSLSWKLVLCGSRDNAYRAFRNAFENPHPDQLQMVKILLVDSEAPVVRSPKAHLLERDGKRWKLDFAPDEAIHLMVQVMETWIVSDQEALVRYYGQGLNVRKLPKRGDIEKVPKAAVQRALKQATRRTQKGAYHKIKHASELLERIDQARVKERCHHCKRLFDTLRQILEL